jgi:class 3 adenylate cyclase/tetratricopeptide (TPR) repeat protein
LLHSCPECGFGNDANDRFCGGCGLKLQAANADADPMQPPAPGLGRTPGERRYVTIFFADLSGYTDLLEHFDAEDLHAVVGRVLQSIDEIIERLGGTVHRHVGDEVMALFGTPVAHGDDPYRALLAATETHAALHELGAELGYEVAVHIGIACGTVIVAAHESGSSSNVEITGSAANLGSRLNKMAKARETVISNEVYEAVRDRVDCESMGEVAIRGIAAPVRVWRVTGHLESKRTNAAAPFVGRREELAQFEDFVSACRDDGIGQSVLIRGEPGIGKSRFLDECRSMAEARGFRWHESFIIDFGTARGRDAISILVASLLNLPVGADTAARASAVDELVSSGLVASSQRVFLNDFLDLPPSEELASLYDAMDNETRKQGRIDLLLSLVRKSTEEGPAVIVVEDLHWADGATLSYLARIARTVRKSGLLLVMTTRFDGDPVDRHWRADAGISSLLTIDLGPLQAADAVELATAFTVRTPEFVEKCVARAEGNPLFLEQLVFSNEAIGGKEIPGTIHSVVMSRVDRLAESDRIAIQAASAMGQRFELDTLRALIGSPGYTCGGLQETFLVRQIGEDFLFGHALIRDAIYASMLNRTRIDLHRRLADWYENRDSKLHAQHLAQAGAPEAPGAFLKAAEAELGSYRYEAALSLIAQGLDCAAEREDVLRLKLLEGEALHDTGRMRQAKLAFSDASAMAATANDRCSALLGLARVKRVIDEVDEALADLDVADTIARQFGLDAERSRIHFLRGNLLFPKGDPDGCYEEHRQGLLLARNVDRKDLEAASLGGIGDAEYARGRMASARKNLEECVRIAEQQGLRRIAVANQAQVAHTMIYTGAQTHAYAAAVKAAESAVTLGHSRAEINARAAILMTLLSVARYDDCLAEAERMKACVDRLGAKRFEQVIYLFGGLAKYGVGRTEDAIAFLREGVEFAHETGFGFHGPCLASALAVCEQSRDRKTELMNVAEEAIAAGCVGHNQFRVYADGIDVAYAMNDTSMLDRFVNAMACYPKDEVVLWGKVHALRGRVLLDRLQRRDCAESELAAGQLAEQLAENQLRHWNRG